MLTKIKSVDPSTLHLAAFFMCLLACLLLTALSAHAADSVRSATDSRIEQRALALSEELRCLVCQNQTLAESHAELAVDLKNLLREKLNQGLSDRQVIDYLVERYGDFVLYRPPVKLITWLLWFGPFVLLIAGIGLLLQKIHRKPIEASANPVDLQRAALLLSGQNAIADAAPNTLSGSASSAPDGSSK